MRIPEAPAAASPPRRAGSAMETASLSTTNPPPPDSERRLWMSLILSEWRLNASPKYLSAKAGEQQLRYALLKAV